jgi:hypothetical protein
MATMPRIAMPLAGVLVGLAVVATALAAPAERPRRLEI